MDENTPDVTQGTEPATDETTVVPGAAEPEAEPAATDETDAQATGETPGPEPKPSGVDRRISKLTWQAREAERREAYWRGIAEAKGGAPAPQGAEPTAKDGPPKQEQFESYDEYLRALTRHEIRTEMAQERQKLTGELEARELHGGFEKRVEAFRKEHADFDEVAFSNDHQVSPTMRDVIMNAPDDGPAIAFWLGQNHDESNRIARLSPNHQILELGRISARIKAPPPAPKPQASAAPAPIKPIRGTDGTFQKDPERMTDAEWWRSQKRSTR